MHSAHEPTFSSLRPPGDSPPDAGDSIETDGAVVETRIFTQPTIPAENARTDFLAKERLVHPCGLPLSRPAARLSSIGVGLFLQAGFEGADAQRTMEFCIMANRAIGARPRGL